MSAQIVHVILYIVHIFHAHVEVYHVLLAWHGLRTGLTWTVNKQGGIKTENLPKQLKLRGAISKFDYDSFLYDDKNETEPVWLSPFFAIFQTPPCKVICVNYAYNHIDIMPAYNK